MLANLKPKSRQCQVTALMGSYKEASNTNVPKGSAQFFAIAELSTSAWRFHSKRKEQESLLSVFQPKTEINVKGGAQIARLFQAFTTRTVMRAPQWGARSCGLDSFVADGASRLLRARLSSLKPVVGDIWRKKAIKKVAANRLSTLAQRALRNPWAKRLAEDIRSMLLSVWPSPSQLT